MDDWFSIIASDCRLEGNAAQELRDVGFIVFPGAVPPGNLAQLSAAYDNAVSSASPSDISMGSSTTRVNDLVNRGREFYELYCNAPILGACCSVICKPFKLSTMHARSVNPNSRAQALHVDFKSDTDGWPMVGFIFMVDEFRQDNGATRFVPGSHRRAVIGDEAIGNAAAGHEPQVLASGPAGSVIVYNGSILHGHSANCTGLPRRSIQGAYIRRDTTAAVNQAARIRQETLARISPLARYLLAV